MADPSVRLDGKTVLITGANTGIGRETVRDLSGRGAKIILACRDVAKAEAVAAEVKAESGGECVVQKLDLADLRSVRECAAKVIEEESRLDILINNAGVMMCPQWKTKDGFEMQIGTNHFGHFLFTNLLLDLLKKSAPSRIVVVSSVAHTRGRMHFDDINLEKKYDAMEAYCQSKLANILFSLELSKRLEGTGVTTYALHPGVVKTDLGRHLHASVNRFIHNSFQFFGRFFFKTPVQGAQTTIYCAVNPKLSEVTGKYYSDCKEKHPHAKARDEEAARKLWDISCQMTGVTI